MNKEAFIQKLIRYLRNADEVEAALKPSTLPEGVKRINMPGLEEMSRKGDLLRLNEAKDIAKQRQTMAALLGGGGVAIGGNELKDYLDSKEAAYLGGFMDKCAEYGLSQEEAEGLAKEAFPARLFYTAGKMFGPSKSRTDATMGAGQAVAGMLPGGGMINPVKQTLGKGKGFMSRAVPFAGKAIGQAAKYSPAVQAGKRVAPAIGGAISAMGPAAGKAVNQASRFSPGLRFGKQLFGR